MMSRTAPAGEEPRAPSRRSRDQRGASAVEYGLLVSGIAALIAVIVFAFGDNIADLFDETCDHVASEASRASC